MLISDPISAFNLSPEQARAFAEKLSKAACKRENSYDKSRGSYTLNMFQAADNNEIVALALLGSWNECMDFIESQGFDLPST